MDLKPGDIIFAHSPDIQYRIIRPLSSGSFGIVYEVQDSQGQSYAFKTITTAWLDSKELSALINEGNLSTKIRHNNVLSVLFFHDGKQYPSLPTYMIMEFADSTLQNLLNERRLTKQHFEEEELCGIFIQLANGMKAVNEILVHRDIKPDNILIKDNVFKIADFGLSKIAGAATRTSTFKGIHHIMYCAPEAWKMQKNTVAMDMYSMGIVFYELATLQHPYQVNKDGDIIENWKNAHLTQVPKDPRTLNPLLNIGLTQLILKMLAKRPEDRYESWDSVIARLQKFESCSKPTCDVSLLVSRALGKKQRDEQAWLKKEAEEKVRREHESLVEYSFNEICKIADDLVNAFNQESDFLKLVFKKVDRFSFHIYAHSPQSQVKTGTRDLIIENPHIIAVISPQYESLNLLDYPIKAWGFVKAPSGRGFNIVIVSKNEEDLYGLCFTLHVRHNPIARRRDQRQEPFPFELRELPEEIKNLKALHIYQAEIDTFKAEFFHPLLEELIESA